MPFLWLYRGKSLERPAHNNIGADQLNSRVSVRVPFLWLYHGKLTKIPLVAIGGINNNNYKKLLLNNANLLAISSYVWSNKKFKPLEAIENLK